MKLTPADFKIIRHALRLAIEFEDSSVDCHSHAPDYREPNKRVPMDGYAESVKRSKQAIRKYARVYAKLTTPREGRE